MVMEFSNILIKKSMKAIIKIIKKKVQVDLSLIKTQNILAISMMALCMDKENFINKKQLDMEYGNRGN